METFWIKALQLIAAFSLLVVIHEFGHYLWARLFRIRVEKFYLFFNPWFSLLQYDPKKGTLRLGTWTKTKKTLLPPDSDGKKQVKKEESERELLKIKVGRDRSADSRVAGWRKTVYGIGWLPLGGYVKIAGMIDESMDKEQMALPPKPDEFRMKPAWQRLFVMTGGVVNNFILAILIYAGIAWYWGEKTIPYENAYEGMDFTEAAQEMGFRTGDIIIAADGKPIDQTDRSHIYKMLEARNITVVRGPQRTDTVTVTMPADAVERLSNSGFMALRVPVFVKAVMPGEAAQKAGLLPGDRLISVDTVATPAFTELSPALLARADKATDLGVIRGNDTIHVTATPNGAGKLGFELKSPVDIFEVKVTQYGMFEAIPVGIKDGTDFLVTYVSSLKHLFSKEGAESVGGFGAIGNMFPPKWDWRTFWEMTAFLSIILAFMNIIPIPALDGGHVAFLLWEVVTRRAPSEKFMEYAQTAGMLFLLALLIYANFNDLYRFVLK